MSSTARFFHQYLRPSERSTRGEEVFYRRANGQVEATVYRPTRQRAKLPGWVVLHGLTRPGRRHPGLIRFVRAIAHAGNVVMVPEIPEWRELRVAPAITIETIRAAVRALQQRADVDHSRVGLFGFSFGATQALIAASDEETAGLLHGIASWGGYADIRRVFRFGLTGLHELDGTTYRLRPDPYGAWIMAANYLPRAPQYRGADAVAHALYQLALESGERRICAAAPVYDPLKLQLRESLTAEQRALFDLIAPLTTAPEPELERTLALADTIAETALQLDPLLDPQPFLPAVRVPVLVAHGRDDRLIPFSESARLGRMLPPSRLVGATITSLFQHSGATQSGLGPLGLAREAARFLLLLRRVLRLV
jgi:pimeloyl-ACP methyl ester carboxylesterase